MSRHFAAALTVALGALFIGNARTAYAVPVLQLYIEGATYDSTTETWTKSFDPSTDTLRVWTIGNVDGPGGHGTISNVKMAIAYADTTPLTQDLTLSLTGTTTGGLGGFTDPSNPGNVASSSFTEITTGADAELPHLTGGAVLPKHGQYVVGIEWQEFLLGNFTLEDSPIEDFINAFPTAGADLEGQINAYIVNVTGATGDVTLHFDLYDSIQAGNKAKAKFAPFSHDAETNGGGPPPPVVPEPGTLALLALGGLGLGAFRRRKPVEA